MDEQPMRSASAADDEVAATEATDRRGFLGRAGAVAAGATAAWVAPQIVSAPAASAGTLPLGQVVAVGELLGSAQAWSSSTNGVTFPPPTALPGSAGYGVAFDGSGLWVAVGDTISTSADGSSWTAAPTPFGFDGRSVATDGQGRWVTVGISPDPVYVSSSPTTGWVLPATPPTQSFLSGVATDGTGHWVTVGASSAFLSTDDGATWTQLDTNLTNFWNAASVATDGAGTWVAVGPLGSWQWTTGAAAWVDVVTPISGSASAVATDGAGLWVAVGASGSAGLAWRSTDLGQTWTAASQPPVDAVTGVAASGAGQWVAVGSGFGSTGSWTSPDGDVWTASTTPLANGTAVTPAFRRLLP